MSIDPSTGTGSGQSSAMMTPVADSSEQTNPNYPASFARQMPAGQVGTTTGDPMPQKKVKEIQNWRQSQVIPDLQAAMMEGSNQDGECLLQDISECCCLVLGVCSWVEVLNVILFYWGILIVDEEEDELEDEEDAQSQSAQYPTALPSSRLGSEVPPSPLRLLQRRNQIYPHGSGTSHLSFLSVHRVFLLSSLCHPSLTFALVGRWHQLFTVTVGSVSPNGSMLVLPYGQSRSNSVESFSSFPSGASNTHSHFHPSFCLPYTTCRVKR